MREIREFFFFFLLSCYIFGKSEKRSSSFTASHASDLLEVPDT